MRHRRFYYPATAFLSVLAFRNSQRRSAPTKKVSKMDHVLNHVKGVMMNDELVNSKGFSSFIKCQGRGKTGASHGIRSPWIPREVARRRIQKEQRKKQ